MSRHLSLIKVSRTPSCARSSSAPQANQPANQHKADQLFKLQQPIRQLTSASRMSLRRGSLVALFLAVILLDACSAAPTGTKKTKALELECLAAHNKWRRLHGASDLVFDKKIAGFAQKRADFIAASDGAEFRHPNDLVYGENLAWHSRPSTSCADLIKMWYDEVDLYDFRSGGFSHETGHFTQLVWRNTEKVGCAKSVSGGPRGGVYLVCNYDPPGNFLGESSENVLRRLQLPVSTTTTTTTTVMPPTTAISATSTTTKRPSLAGTTPKSNNNNKKKKKNKKNNKKKGTGNKNKKKKQNKNKKNNKKNNSVTNSNANGQSNSSVVLATG